MAAASGSADDDSDDEGAVALDFWPELFGVDVPTRLQRLALSACCCCVREAPEDEEAGGTEAVEVVGGAVLALAASGARRDVLSPAPRALRCAVRYPRAPFYLFRRALGSLLRAYIARVPPAPLWASALADAVIYSAPVRHFYTLLIVANSVALGLQHAGQSQAWTDGLAAANAAFVALFALEILLKVIADGLRGFFRDGFNTFDVAVVGISLVDLVLTAEGSSGGGGLGGGYTALRSLRVFRVFKLLRVWTSLRNLMAALLRGLRAALVSFALLLFVVFVFALLGMQAFGGGYDAIEATAASPWAALQGRQAAPKPQLNFDSLFWAMITVCEVMDNENWDVTVRAAAPFPAALRRAKGPFSPARPALPRPAPPRPLAAQVSHGGLRLGLLLLLRGDHRRGQLHLPQPLRVHPHDRAAGRGDQRGRGHPRGGGGGRDEGRARAREPRGDRGSRGGREDPVVPAALLAHARALPQRAPRASAHRRLRALRGPECGARGRAGLWRGRRRGELRGAVNFWAR